MYLDGSEIHWYFDFVIVIGNPVLHLIHRSVEDIRTLLFPESVNDGSSISFPGLFLFVYLLLFSKRCKVVEEACDLRIVLLELVDFRNREIFLLTISLSELQLVNSMLELLLRLLLSLLLLLRLVRSGCFVIDSTVFKKQCHDIILMMLPSPMQWSMPLHISLIDKCSSLNQIPHNFEVTLTRCVKQRSLLDVILLVGIGTSFYE